MKRIYNDEGDFYEKKYKVGFAAENYEVRCCCHKFERIDILCRHAWAVQVRRVVMVLFKSCIL